MMNIAFFSCPMKLDRVGEADVAPTKSTADEMAEKAKEQLAKLAKEMGIPTWALYCIGIGKRSHFLKSVLLKAFENRFESNYRLAKQSVVSKKNQSRRRSNKTRKHNFPLAFSYFMTLEAR